ncbi:ligand-binding sensor domain-containing diguanylate cyclase [Dokdonella koreensis]|uniref:diguanylate cyclase n=1 Tax=Dokdonella koreensis DS-123 TaxID=1300342 RepID=A0A160DV51_9GAMM|nr:ligand-binding sensor domain-containing diguanylate cyclase [Dokdonella koreensis]ANB18398.1 Putative sensor protein [Dokdonella koreensis DS-123]
MRYVLLMLWAVLLLAGRPALGLDPARAVDAYTVTGWTMDDGLPHNLILGIAQDAEGFIWVGTWEGAARFNGRSFTPLDGYTLPGIRLTGVRSIVRDHDDAMLFGTAQNGVFRYDGTHWEPLGDGAAATLRVTTLLRSGDDLWVGTEDSLYRLDRDLRLHAPPADSPLDGRHVFCVLPEADGGLLAGTDRGLFRLPGARVTSAERVAGLPLAPVRQLVRATDGAVYAGGDSGAWRLAPGVAAERLVDARVETLVEGDDGALWLSTAASGVLRLYRGRTERIDPRVSLVNRGTAALMQDREGLLWVGTATGLFRIADGPARGLGDRYVRAVLQAADGTVWVGDADGLARWREGRIERVRLGDAAPVSVLALAPASDGGLWVGTYDQGVVHRRGEAAATTLPDRIDRSHGLPSNHVRTILEDDDGSVWIGTTGGLTHWRGGEIRTYRVADGLPADFVRVLHKAADGTLWIGTSAGIAARRADGRLDSWRARETFPATGSFDFLDDADGGVWIASDAGLLRLRDGRFTVYDHTRGLPRDTVFRVLDDGRGHLWLSSNHGIFRIARSTFADLDAGRIAQLPVEVIDRTDGMPSSQANGGSTPAGGLMDDGTLWFPTAAGVAVIDPALLGTSPDAAVPVAFERLTADGTEIPLQAAPAFDARTRRIAIGYAGLRFRAPDDIRYRYRMTGFDAGWVDAGKDTEAVYTNLPPGRFVFEVQAARAPADWAAIADAPGARMAIQVAAPFWRSAWFVALVVLAGAVLVDGLYRLRSAALHRRQARLSQLVEERTAELSAKNAALEQANREREDLLERLAHQALHDPLTGLPNRRAGDAFLARTIERAAGSGEPFCIGLLDVDRFKRINDEYGHDAGDAVLRQVAALLVEHLGADGFAARHGGEEFLIALVGCSPAAALHSVESLRERIAQSPLEGSGGRTLRCTASIGLAQWEPSLGARQLLALADRRLYRAKQRGRNRVVADEREDDGPGAGPDARRGEVRP